MHTSEELDDLICYRDHGSQEQEQIISLYTEEGTVIAQFQSECDHEMCPIIARKAVVDREEKPWGIHLLQYLLLLFILIIAGIIMCASMLYIKDLIPRKYSLDVWTLFIMPGFMTIVVIVLFTNQDQGKTMKWISGNGIKGVKNFISSSAYYWSDVQIIEGCKFCNCLRLYDLSQNKVQTLYRYPDFEPHKLALGPKNCILACSKAGKFYILMLDMLASLTTKHGHFQLIGVREIHGMTFLPSLNMAVFLNQASHDILAITLYNMDSLKTVKFCTHKAHTSGNFPAEILSLDRYERILMLLDDGNKVLLINENAGFVLQFPLSKTLDFKWDTNKLKFLIEHGLKSGLMTYCNISSKNNGLQRKLSQPRWIPCLYCCLFIASILIVSTHVLFLLRPLQIILPTINVCTELPGD